MPDLKTTSTGQCRCGKVAFSVTSDPLLTMACHCAGCQQMTASAFSLSALYTSDAFSITSGDVVVGGLHGPTRHYFCDHCKSWLFTRPEGMDSFVNVRATMMNDAAGFVPFIETFTDERLPWAATPAVHSFAGFPAASDYPRLISEYATWAG